MSGTERDRYSKQEYLTNQSSIHRKVIENPRLLNEDEKLILGEELLAVASDGFMRNPDQTLGEDVYVHTFDCDRLTILVNNQDEIKGFIAANISKATGSSIYYLGGVILKTEIQGRGIAKKMLEQELAECDADILCFHTQSESMRKLGRKLAVQDDALAKSMFENHPGFALLSSGQAVQKGRYFLRYQGSLYGDTQRFSSQSISEPGFDFLDGDAVIFTGYVKKEGLDD